MICSAHRLIRRCGNENEPVASGVLSVSSFSSFNIWRLLIIKVTFLITKFKRATCNGNSFHIICLFNLKTNYSWIWSGSLVLPAVDHHPNGNDGSETKAEPDEHVLVELRLLQTWRKGFCHVDPILFTSFIIISIIVWLTLHLVRAIVLPTIADVVANKFSATSFPSFPISQLKKFNGIFSQNHIFG